MGRCGEKWGEVWGEDGRSVEVGRDEEKCGRGWVGGEKCGEGGEKMGRCGEGEEMVGRSVGKVGRCREVGRDEEKWETWGGSEERVVE